MRTQDVNKQERATLHDEHELVRTRTLSRGGKETPMTDFHPQSPDANPDVICEDEGFSDLASSSTFQ